MQYMSKAEEVGKRCRRFRNALGLSQQALADQVRTSPQNISKFEKEGIHDIDMIDRLSEVLGKNLLQDEVDAEGSVNEFGREILSQLVTSGGNMCAEALLNTESMWGLPVDRILKEMLKLESLGLCVREQYTNVYGHTCDEIYITAKGVIRLKNIGVSDDVSKIQTYEMVCHGYDSIQEYTDNDPLKKLSADLEFKSGFRVNLIRHIKKRYGYELGIDNEWDDIFWNQGLNKVFPGNSCYCDIMYSLMRRIDRRAADHIMDKYYEADMDQAYDEMYEYFQLSDELNCWEQEEASLLSLLEENGLMIDSKKIEERRAEHRAETVRYESGSEMEKKMRRLEELDNDLCDYSELDCEFPIVVYEGEDPLKWFSKEDIERFVDECKFEAQTEEERRMDTVLVELMKAVPDIVKSYFSFPYEWEQNGLADQLKKLFHVPMSEEKIVSSDTPV